MNLKALAAGVQKGMDSSGVEAIVDVDEEGGGLIILACSDQVEQVREMFWWMNGPLDIECPVSLQIADGDQKKDCESCRCDDPNDCHECGGKS